MDLEIYCLEETRRKDIGANMAIAFIAFGVTTGLFAAAVTLLSGSGVLLAFLAYVLGGMAAIPLVVLWKLRPSRTTSAKHVTT